MRKLILVTGILLGLSQVTQAALFDDKEARQQIQDLQQKFDTQNQNTQATLDSIKKNQQSLEQRIVSLESVIKSQGLMDLLGQVDHLNQELSRVQGELEIAQHNLEITQQRQKDLYGDTDSRLRKLEANSSTNNQVPDNVVQPNNSIPAESSGESKDFEAAQALSKAGKYKEAFDAYNKFIETYPNGQRTSEAEYELGLTQFSLKNYKAAIATQQKLLKQFPDSVKAPDATFNIANCQIQLADIDGAKKTLHELLTKYPNSEVVPNAKRRLSVLESIKR